MLTSVLKALGRLVAFKTLMLTLCMSNYSICVLARAILLLLQDATPSEPVYNAFEYKDQRVSIDEVR